MSELDALLRGAAYDTIEVAGQALPQRKILQCVELPMSNDAVARKTVGDARMPRIRLHTKGNNTVGLWQFQESLVDSSGNGFDLSLAAGNLRYVELAPGLRGVKLLSGTKLNHAVTETALKITGDLTIAMLVSVDALAGGAFLAYYNPGETANDNVQYAVTLFSLSGTIDLEWYQEQGVGVDEVYYPARVPPQFQLCHLVMRRRNGIVEFFLNGRRFGAPSHALPVPTGGSASTLWIGYSDNPTAQCTLASLRIDNVALTEQQIANLYNDTMGPVHSECEASPAAPLYASQLDGVNEYGSIGNVAALQKERNQTFSMLVRASWTPLQLMILAGKMGNTTNNRGYDMHTNVLGGVNVNLNNINPTNKIGVRAPGPWNDGQMRDFLFTYDGSSTAAGCKIYVNGVNQVLEVYGDTLSGTILDPASFLIGCRFEPGQVFPFAGTIKDVAMWSSVVSGADALLIFQALPYRSLHTVGPSANLVGWWQMGDGVTAQGFPSVPDSSVNTNVCTLTNCEIVDLVQVYP